MGAAPVNRWRQRLGELRGENRQVLAEPAGVVQNVRNVQNPLPDRLFEHFDQIEQPAATVAPATDRALATWGEVEAERAAIVEKDGGIPRAWAEGFARLDPDWPPREVPPKRWQRFVDDAGLFLDSRFCAIAAALDWGSFDLFCCDRDRPFARIDCAGLLWLLNGDKLIALTENTATIETRTGARQIYRRTPSEPGRALAWELGDAADDPSGVCRCNR